MVVLSTQIDRRQHIREGLMAQLEDITYAVLRKCADISDRVNQAPVCNANVVLVSSLMAVSEKPSIS